MTILFRQSAMRVAPVVLLVTALIVYPCVSCGEYPAARAFPLRNQNPFLQIFGQPAFQSAVLARPGEAEYRVSLDLANHADAGNTTLENFVIDGETYWLSLSLRRRVAGWLELGVDVPLVAHSGGFMDNAIESWHSMLGLSNSKREGPDNQLSYLYERGGTTLYELNSSAAGLGDIQLTAAIPFVEGGGGVPAVALRSTLKLPTGEADKLLGSGAADFSIGVFVSDTHTLFGRQLGVGGFAGALLLGDGDILPTMQRDTVAFAGVAANWQATERFAVAMQVYAQGSYFDSELEELGGDTVQLAVGADYRTRDKGLLLALALVEDVSANATTDFALHFSIRIGGG